MPLDRTQRRLTKKAVNWPPSSWDQPGLGGPRRLDHFLELLQGLFEAPASLWVPPLGTGVRIRWRSVPPLQPDAGKTERSGRRCSLNSWTRLNVERAGCRARGWA